MAGNQKGGGPMGMDFKRILCPVDLSAFSLTAVKLAVKIAETGGARLYLLHVIDNPFDELYLTSITQTDPAAIDLYKSESQRRSKIVRATEEHSVVLLKQFCHDSVEHLPRVRYVVSSGDPFEKILDAAEAHRIDLIVLATHGRTGIKRLIIGNVAEKVVRHAPCPVMTVKPRAARRKPKENESKSRRVA
jgi:nucleotide-binding universal stress UspA family protein